MTTAPADESTWRAANSESLADGEPAFQQPGFEEPRFEQPGKFAPAFPAEAGRPQPNDLRSDDSFQPTDRFTTSPGRSPDQSPVDAVGESSRQLEQTARDLETSLTHLFTTQIESLQRLRDRIDEHERRWFEQQGARRATL